MDCYLCLIWRPLKLERIHIHIAVWRRQTVSNFGHSRPSGWRFSLFGSFLASSVWRLASSICLQRLADKASLLPSIRSDSSKVSVAANLSRESRNRNRADIDSELHVKASLAERRVNEGQRLRVVSFGREIRPSLCRCFVFHPIGLALLFLFLF